VLGLDRAGAQAEADRCRHLLAGVYQGLGEIDPALALLDQLAENLDGPDNLPHRAQVLEEAGGILYDADRDAVAAQKFAAAAAAWRLAGRPVDELRARRRELLALHWSGDLPAAVAGIERVDEAAGALAGLPDEPPVVTYERAMAADAVARVLTAEDRLTAALDRVAGVPERLRSIEAFGEAAQVEVFTGELLLRDGRPDAAERLLRPVLGGLPGGSRPAAQAAWLLARALDDLGRPAEAAKIRAEHGIEEE
jgi:tetratricopeptide (TPR) repeat protein